MIIFFISEKKVKREDQVVVDAAQELLARIAKAEKETAEVYSCLFHPKVLRGRVNAKNLEKNRNVRDSIFSEGNSERGKETRERTDSDKQKHTNGWSN